MSLEAQKVSDEKERKQFNKLVKDLLDDSPKKLWDD